MGLLTISSQAVPPAHLVATEILRAIILGKKERLPLPVLQMIQLRFGDENGQARDLNESQEFQHYRSSQEGRNIGLGQGGPKAPPREHAFESGNEQRKVKIPDPQVGRRLY